MGIYNAEISAGSLMIPESRRIAKLLLVSPTVEQWDHAIEVENILQKKPATARRQARLMRNRLETLDQDGWQLIAEGDTEVASQILLAASIRHSQLLSDFLRDVYMVDLQKLEKTLSHHQWDAFISECEHRDAAVDNWAPSTRDKLFQVVVRILAEAKYLDSTRRLGLTPPMLHPKTRNYLKKLGDRATLSVMEAH
ncbi:MAG: DUF1819 family protein [Betaproteobacteria bacterium]